MPGAVPSPLQPSNRLHLGFLGEDERQRRTLLRIAKQLGMYKTRVQESLKKVIPDQQNERAEHVHAIERLDNLKVASKETATDLQIDMDSAFLFELMSFWHIGIATAFSNYLETPPKKEEVVNPGTLAAEEKHAEKRQAFIYHLTDIFQKLESSVHTDFTPTAEETHPPGANCVAALKEHKQEAEEVLVLYLELHNAYMKKREDELSHVIKEGRWFASAYTQHENSSSLRRLLIQIASWTL